MRWLSFKAIHSTAGQDQQDSLRLTGLMYSRPDQDSDLNHILWRPLTTSTCKFSYN